MDSSPPPPLSSLKSPYILRGFFRGFVAVPGAPPPRTSRTSHHTHTHKQSALYQRAPLALSFLCAQLPTQRSLPAAVLQPPPIRSEPRARAMDIERQHQEAADRELVRLQRLPPPPFQGFTYKKKKKAGDDDGEMEMRIKLPSDTDIGYLQDPFCMLLVLYRGLAPASPLDLKVKGQFLCVPLGGPCLGGVWAPAAPSLFSHCSPPSRMRTPYPTPAQLLHQGRGRRQPGPPARWGQLQLYRADQQGPGVRRLAQRHGAHQPAAPQGPRPRGHCGAAG